MAEIARLNIPLANYPSGSREFGPINVNPALRRLTFTVSRCTTATPTIWPNESTTLDVSIEGLYGADWRPLGGALWSGGNSNERPTTSIIVDWSSTPDARPSQLRASLVISGGPLRTSGALVAED